MTMRPDPTFHASPKLAMEAPPESFAYTLLLSPDFSKPDALAVIDVKPGSPTFSQIVHTVTMPNKGDEFHHFGWNACSSALSPLSGHAFLERRYLIIPGIRSSRIYVIDTKPDPTKAKIHKIIEPEEVFKKTGYSRPHTVHCGPEGIYVRTLGGGGKDGADGPPGILTSRRGRSPTAPEARAGSNCKRRLSLRGLPPVERVGGADMMSLQPSGYSPNA
jgi:selenium-binding protein 1